MKKIQRAVTRTLVGTTLVLSAAACSDEFLKVTNFLKQVTWRVSMPILSGALMRRQAQR